MFLVKNINFHVMFQKGHLENLMIFTAPRLARGTCVTLFSEFGKLGSVLKISQKNCIVLKPSHIQGFLCIFKIEGDISISFGKKWSWSPCTICAARCNSMNTLQAFSFRRGQFLMIFGETATKIITSFVST